MEWNTVDPNSWSAKLVMRVGGKLRSNKQFTQEAVDQNNAKTARRRLRKREQHATEHGYQARGSQSISTPQQDINELGERKYSVFSQASTLVDSPRKDHTQMLHSLAHHDSFDSLLDQIVPEKVGGPAGAIEKGFEILDHVSSIQEQMIARVPTAVWTQISSYLDPADAARLAFSSQTLHQKIGTASFEALHSPEHKSFKIVFLQDMDHQLPQQLLCFACARFHRRLRPGKESLRADFVSNPIFHCPKTHDSVLSRMRLTSDRELPYSYVQLALRSHRYGSVYGINHEDLSRRWKHANGWSHQTRYMVHNNRLLLRVVSQAHAPPAATLTATAERHLLYDPEEYTPLFSACAHWRDGELMRVCKCALNHVPSPPDPYLQQLKRGPKIDRAAARPNFIVTRCDWCRPARRCPECPTEYLIEIQMVEDKKDAVHPFRHAIVVTRWSDLGDGSSPDTSPEWAAINGLPLLSEDGVIPYESFSQVGRRAVSGIFESRISGSIPGHRMLSLNPTNKKLGEEGHGWY